MIWCLRRGKLVAGYVAYNPESGVQKKPGKNVKDPDVWVWRKVLLEKEMVV
jgi:hypothetical protein